MYPRVRKANFAMTDTKKSDVGVKFFFTGLNVREISNKIRIFYIFVIKKL